MGESGKSPGWGQVVVIILAVFGAFGTGFLYLDSQISAGDAELRGAIKDSLQATTQLRTTVVALNTNVETLSTNVGKLTDSVDKLSQRVSYHDGLEDGKSRGGQ